MSKIDTLSSTQRRAGKKEGIVVLLGSCLTIMGTIMITPILPKMGAELGPLSVHADLLVPLVATGPALAIAVFAPVASLLVDRIGRKQLLILATLVYVVSGFAPSQLHALEDIFLARMLLGIAEAFIMTCCTTLIGDYWQGDERQKYVKRQAITINLMGSLFFVIGGWIGAASWRNPFYLYLLPLLLVPFMRKLLWEPLWKAHASPTVDVPAERGGRQAIVVAGFLVFVGMAGTFIVPVQAPTLLGNLGISSTTLIGISISVGPLAALLGSLLWPFVRERAGIALTNATLLGLIAIGLIWLTQARSYSNVLMAIFVHGIGAGLLVPNVLARLLEKLTPSLRAKGVGVFTSCLFLGQFVSPLLVVMLAAPKQDIATGIDRYALGLLALAAAWVAVAVRDRRRTGLSH